MPQSHSHRPTTQLSGRDIHPNKPEAVRKANKDDTCFNCRKLGHFAKDCPEPRREGLHTIYDETGELIQDVDAENLHLLVEEEEPTPLSEISPETSYENNQSVNTPSGEVCSLTDGSDYESGSYKSGERFAMMNTIDSCDFACKFAFRDPITGEWVLKDRMEDIITHVERRFTSSAIYSDDIVISTDSANVGIQPVTSVPESPRIRFDRQWISRVTRWVREQTKINLLLDDEYGTDTPSSSEESSSVSGSDYTRSQSIVQSSWNTNSMICLTFRMYPIHQWHLRKTIWRSTR